MKKKVKKIDLLKATNVTEVFDIFNGDNKNPGIPKNGNNTFRVNATDSSEKKEKMGMNQLDKLGYLRMQNVMLDRSGMLRENDMEVYDKFVDDNPDLILKINLFISDLNNFNLNDDIKKFIVDYISNKIK
jgi:hypothetical protein